MPRESRAPVPLTGNAKASTRIFLTIVDRRNLATHRFMEHLLEKLGGSNRGRNASSPAQIPPRGWKDIFLRIYHGVSEDRILAISAGVTFFVLLAIFPAIAGLIALYGLYADPQTISQHLAAAAGVLPEGGLQIIREQVERLTSQPSQRLGLATLIGLAVALWSANGGMKALFDALNVVYHEKEKRGA